MSKLLSIGLIIFFVAIIAVGMIILAFRKVAPPRQDVLFPPPTTDGKIEPPKQQKQQPSLLGLTQILKESVAGFAVTKDGIRFIERATGNVWETDARAATTTIVSNTTIPYIFDVSWSFDANAAVIRYREEETIKTSLAQFVKGSTKGVLLPDNITSFSFSPDRPRLFYLVRADNELVGIAANTDNSNQSEILRLPFADFEARWITPREISFLTKPSGEAEGFLYRYRIDEASFEKIIGGIFGLEALWSENGSKILFSQFNQSTKRPQLAVYDIKQNKTQNLSIDGLANKCSWFDDDTVYCAIPTLIPQGTYPDDWFSGSVSFSDNIVKIKISKNEKNIVKALGSIDVANLLISQDKKYLYFQNKKDGSLWSLSL